MLKDLLFTKTHEWVRVEDDIAMIGITEFAQEQLGDITYVELPPVGTDLEAGQEMGSVESVKAASELFSPVTGQVVAINEELEATPEKVNTDPYGEGWMLRVRLSDEPEGLLSPEAYEEIANAEQH